MRPNIFDIATKELSQDAFITWLLQFADDKYLLEDPNISECGKAFVTQLISKQISNFKEPIKNVEAGRQWQGIDVWAKVNDKYLIVIEDKTNSSYHSNQLARYKVDAENWCVKENYQIPICIYLKTGNESLSSLSHIQPEGFEIFGRLEFINLLKQYKDNSNNIFIDFYNRLTRLEELNEEYETKLIEDWKGNDWQGFFQFLEKEIDIVNWHYVSNPSGGFWNAILNWDCWGAFPVFLQIEQGNLCFKISTDPAHVEMPEDVTRADIRSKLHSLILNNARELDFRHIRRPNRFGSGTYMTVAVVDRENWLGADREKINKLKIGKTLTDYVNFLRATIKK